ncbi:MAG: SagB family peptide dehydrogenase [Methylophilus sp.]|jgi:SagB-type dehydrogenase family enzyme
MQSAKALLADHAVDIARDYHQRTKHKFEQYAAGPETLDWDAQASPFRRFTDTVEIALPAFDDEHPALSNALGRPFTSLTSSINPLTFDLTTLGALLQLSFGITAWKTYGPDRWAVRANPSSGNLHPIEVYILVSGFAQIADGVYHYRVEDHTLERRADFASKPSGLPSLHIGLSSIMWREAWKYGERAFRYCQLDTGHAIAALSYAASILGWSITENKQYSSSALAKLMGLDRLADFPYKRFQETEQEEAEVLFAVKFNAADKIADSMSASAWKGTASSIDRHPMYRWPAIKQVAEATRYLSRLTLPAPSLASPSLNSVSSNKTAAEVILGRRSAQRFDASYIMPKQVFTSMLEALLPQASMPWNALSCPPLINLVFFIHRVEGFTSGLYLLVREPRLKQQLELSLNQAFVRVTITGLADAVNLQLLSPISSAELQRTARSLHCHQDIAANACFAVGMLAEFDATLACDASSYRDMHREAGVIGQALYLQAETHGLRGTGIGCFFDDPIHQLLGLADDTFQTIYHFTVGLAIEDTRITTTVSFSKPLPNQ